MLKLNQVENVSIYESDRYDECEGKGFAAIITNPPIRAGKKVVHSIFEKAYEHLDGKWRALGCDSKEARSSFCDGKN